MDARFYLRLHLHKGATLTRVDAPYLPALPVLQETDMGYCAVLANDSITQPGLYLWSGKQWQIVMPQKYVSYAYLQSLKVDVYFCCHDSRELEAQYVFRNGVLTGHENITVSANDTSRWATLTSQYSSGAGTVTSVNDVAPNSNGNVYLPQYMQYTVSVPVEAPSEGTIWYQQFIDELEFVRFQGSILEAPEQEVELSVLLNSLPAGTITLGPNGVEQDLDITTVPAGSTIQIVTPEDTTGAQNFSLTFEFKRN